MSIGQRISSRSDIFPKLINMQRALNARNFAIFRVSGSGLPNKRKLVCEMENWGITAAEHCGAFLQAYGERLLNHIELSLLPMIWKSRLQHDSRPGFKGSSMVEILEEPQLSLKELLSLFASVPLAMVTWPSQVRPWISRATLSSINMFAAAIS